MNDVPDVEKADFIIAVANAAGREGDIEFLEKLLALNPGSIKNVGIQSFARSVNGREGIEEVLALVSEEMLPEEKEATWKGLISPMLHLSGKELASLHESGVIPEEFGERVELVVGVNLGNTPPDQAQSIIEGYPSEMQERIETTYWRQLVASNPDMARRAFDAGNVPKTSWISVGRGVVDEIIRDESLDAALRYSLDRINNEQQEALANYVFDLWMKNDSITASEKASQLPSGPALNGAAKAIALRLEKLGDHQAADQWRSLIQPE
ncbi:hypothetical protein [Haloferula sp.]|uniref:hypothetical protein n=1 Tax=Haloferula sp. TaxID=2497595 RepID=UPI003C722DE7